MPAKKKSVRKKIISPSASVVPTPMAKPVVPEVPVPQSFDETAFEKTSALDEETTIIRGNRTWVWLGMAITILIVVLTVIAGIFLTTAPNVAKTAILPTPSVAVTTTLAPTPAYSKASLTFEVLNGSGVAGAAGMVAQKLRDAGFVVVAVGNADGTQATSTLQVQFSLSGSLSQIVKDVSGVVPVSSSSADLQGSTASARLTIGKK